MSTSIAFGGVTVREAARRAHRAEETIRRWIWSGRLPARKRGNVLYIAERDLDTVIHSSSHSVRTSGDGRPVTLGEWFAELAVWRRERPDRHSESAASLVVEDRDDRAGR